MIGDAPVPVGPSAPDTTFDDGSHHAVGPPSAPIVRGADLVVLAEAAQVRLFRLSGVFLLVGAVLAFVFGSGSSDDPGVVTVLAALVGGVAAVVVAVRPLPAYLVLRRSRAVRLAVVAAAGAAVLLNGIDGPAWWVALGAVLLLSTVSSMRFAITAAFAIAVAYVVGSLLAGGTLARNGIDAGVVAGASGLPLYALVMRVVTEGFARVLLMLHRSATAEVRGLPVAPEPPLRADGSPWVPRPGTAETVAVVRVDGPDDVAVERGTPGPPDGLGPRDGPGAPDGAGPNGTTGPAETARPGRTARGGRSARLTVRQLEVALLARDGLLQAEIAEALGISVTQVERHLRQGRERADAATVGELLGVLVEDGIIGPPQADHAAVPALGAGAARPWPTRMERAG